MIPNRPPVQLRDSRTSELVFEGDLIQASRIYKEMGDTLIWDGNVPDSIDVDAVISQHEEQVAALETVVAEETEPDAQATLQDRIDEMRKAGAPPENALEEVVRIQKDAHARVKAHAKDVPDEFPIPQPPPPDMETETGIIKALHIGMIDEVEYEARRNEMVRAERIAQGRDAQTGIPFEELAARLSMSAEEVEERLSQQA